MGGNGYLAVYERIDGKKEPYIETKRLNLGALRLNYAAVFPSEDRMVVITKNSRLLLVHLETRGPSFSVRSGAIQSGDYNRRTSSVSMDLYAREMKGREGTGTGSMNGTKLIGDYTKASDIQYGGHHLQQVWCDFIIK